MLFDNNNFKHFWNYFKKRNNTHAQDLYFNVDFNWKKNPNYYRELLGLKIKMNWRKKTVKIASQERQIDCMCECMRERERSNEKKNKKNKQKQR